MSVRKKSLAAIWDEGFRGTTQIQRNCCFSLIVLNADKRFGFPKKLRVSTRSARKGSHQPPSLWSARMNSQSLQSHIQILYHLLVNCQCFFLNFFFFLTVFLV